MSDAPKPGAVDEQKAIGTEDIAKTTAEKEATASAGDYQSESSNVDGAPAMNVKVYSPTNDYFDGPAFSISAENDTGPFDILPKHHNFITLLNACDLLVRTTNKDDRRITISGGLMHVKADRVTVFLDV